MSIPDGFVSKKKAIEVLGVSGSTLKEWRTKGKIKYIRPSTKYYYCIKELCKVSEAQKRNYTYARVSTRSQQSNLINQVEYLKQQYPDYTSITDIGSGINFKRKGLKTILEQCDQGKVGEVVVSFKDRLCRFGFDLIKWFIERKGGKVVVLNNKETSPEEELTEDLLSIITVFSARIHGKRNYKVEIERYKNLSHNKSEKDT